MAVTATQTVRDITEAALLDLEASTMGQAINARYSDHAVKTLNRLMKSWQLRDDTPSFLKSSMTVALTLAGSYTLAPVRPVRILSARFKTSASELPMTRLTRQEYDDLPNKAVTGTPTQFYYDRQKEAALLYVWPKPSVAANTIEITYEREFEDVGINDAIDLPGEWWDVAVKQLAARLVNAYGSEASKARLPGEAEGALNMALGAAMDGESVMFGG
jgi:hypothetical protein